MTLDGFDLLQSAREIRAGLEAVGKGLEAIAVALSKK